MSRLSLWPVSQGPTSGTPGWAQGHDSASPTSGGLLAPQHKTTLGTDLGRTGAKSTQEERLVFENLFILKHETQAE